MKKDLIIKFYPIIKEDTNIEGYRYDSYVSWEDIDGFNYSHEWWSIYSDGTIDWSEYDSECDEQLSGDGRFDSSKYDAYVNEMMGHNTSWKDELIELII